MVSDVSYLANLRFDDSNLIKQVNTIKSEASEATKTITELGNRWSRLKATIQKEATNILGSLAVLVGVIKNTVLAMGVILDPIQNYIFGIITITVTTLLNMAVAASATGIGAPLGVIIAAAAGVFSIVSTANATAGFNEASAQFQRASAALSGLGTLGRSLSWAGG